MNKLLLMFAIIALPSISTPQEPQRFDTEAAYIPFNNYVVQYGKDKVLHFYAGFSLTYANGGDTQYLLGPIIDAQISALRGGLDKEFDDVGVTFTNRQAIYKELKTMQESNRKIWEMVEKLKLDEGDLLADYGGISLAGAILTMHQFILIDNSTNSVHN